MFWKNHLLERSFQQWEHRVRINPFSPVLQYSVRHRADVFLLPYDHSFTSFLGLLVFFGLLGMNSDFVFTKWSEICSLFVVSSQATIIELIISEMRGLLVAAKITPFAVKIRFNVRTTVKQSWKKQHQIRFPSKSMFTWENWGNFTQIIHPSNATYAFSLLYRTNVHLVVSITILGHLVPVPNLFLGVFSCFLIILMVMKGRAKQTA